MGNAMDIHFVAQWYQKRFSLDGTSIWFGTRDELRRRPISRTAQEEDLHEASIEAMITREIDTPASLVWDRFTAGQWLNTDERSDVIRFICAQQRRGPQSYWQMQEDVAAELPKIQAPLSDQHLMKLVDEWMTSNGFVGAAIRQAKFQEVKRDVSPVFEPEYWKVFIPLSLFSQDSVDRLVDKLSWVIWQSDSDANHFITSDEPFLLIPRESIVFPLSRHTCLEIPLPQPAPQTREGFIALVDLIPEDSWTSNKRTASPPIVAALNSYIAGSAYRGILASTRDLADQFRHMIKIDETVHRHVKPPNNDRWNHYRPLKERREIGRRRKHRSVGPADQSGPI